jgi:hypothetical protein
LALSNVDVSRGRESKPNLESGLLLVLPTIRDLQLVVDVVAEIDFSVHEQKIVLDVESDFASLGCGAYLWA